MRKHGCGHGAISEAIGYSHPPIATAIGYSQPSVSMWLDTLGLVLGPSPWEVRADHVEICGSKSFIALRFGSSCQDEDEKILYRPQDEDDGHQDAVPENAENYHDVFQEEDARGVSGIRFVTAVIKSDARSRNSVLFKVCLPTLMFEEIRHSNAHFIPLCCLGLPGALLVPACGVAIQPQCIP